MAESKADVERLALDTGFAVAKGGKFRGYTRTNISERPVRQAKNKTWGVSRKVKRGRTQRRYKRNKDRGNVRPAMRRQLGAGGKRASTKR